MFDYWQFKKSQDKSTKERVLVLACLILALSAALSLSPFATSDRQDVIYCAADSLLNGALQAIYRATQVVQDDAKNALYHLEDGALAVETFAYVAEPALDQKLAQHWYPLYNTGYVIAVDRNVVAADIAEFSDLVKLELAVSIPSSKVALRNLIATLAYDGQTNSFDLARATTQMLTILYNRQQLLYDDGAAPLIICYDYQAQQLKQNRPQLDIVVPTQRLIFKGGLLSTKPLAQLQSASAQLTRQLTARGYADNLATAEQWQRQGAIRSQQIDLFDDVTRTMRRRVKGSHIYRTADGRGHFLIGLLTAVVIAIWTISLYARSSQKSMRKAMLLNGILLVGWFTVRIIKYLLYDRKILDAYLWYSFYIFILLLPVTFLWLVLSCDRFEDSGKMPKLISVLFVVNFIIIGLLFSNNLHHLFFQFDLTLPDWNRHYSYGALFWAMYAFFFSEIIAGIIILVYKAFKSQKKRNYLGPFIVIILTVSFSFLYVARIVMHAFDITLWTGIFNMLFFESALRSGLISVNAQYGKLFKCAKLNMQILNRGGDVVLAAGAAGAIPALSQSQLEDVARFPLQLDEAPICTSMPSTAATFVISMMSRASISCAATWRTALKN